jgi:UDP-glucose 4-epimerase
MRMLITGGAGFLGSHLAERLLLDGHQVDIVDLPHTIQAGKISHIEGKSDLSIYAGSILDRKLMEKLIPQCDLVLHFAAVVGVSHYIAKPYDVLNVNINGTQLVLDIALRHGKKVIYASTSEVYGKSGKVPFHEDDDRILGPTNIDRWSYSTSKSVGEHFCFAMQAKGLRFVILRFFNAYGPRLDSIESGRVLSLFIGKCLKGEPLIVHGDGNQTRCFTYISDTIEGIIRASQNPGAEGQVFNIGADIETKILDLAEKTCEIFGRKPNIVFQNHDVEYGLSYEDIYRRVPCVEKARKMLGFEAIVGLDEGLRRTIDAFRRDWDEGKTVLETRK